MSFDPKILLYGFYAALFLATLFLVQGLAALHGAQRWNAANRLRRMRHDADPAPGRAGGGTLRRGRGDPAVASGPAARPARALTRLLAHAGLALSARAASIAILGLTIAATLGFAALLHASGMFSSAPWLVLACAVPAGAAVGVGVPISYLRHRRARRLARFAAQLPEALDVMVRCLRAGHPVFAAMTRVRTDLPEPIAGAFGKAVDEMTYGLDLRQALGHLSARVDLPDLRFVAASVSLQHETGGNLAEVLQRLAELMRARFRLTRKVRAYSAEARLSARILAVMPFVFVGLVFAANPDVYGDAARDPLVLPVLLGAGALQVVGILVMRRMAGIRV